LPANRISLKSLGIEVFSDTLSAVEHFTTQALLVVEICFIAEYEK
jgi:hypothetical protein